MKVEMSLGDVVDRMTILRIKGERIADPTKRENVARELCSLVSAWFASGLPDVESLPDWWALSAVNLRLWIVEDELRDHERAENFGPAFVERARAVYHLNDERAALKRSINLSLGSELVEEKSYAAYRRPNEGTP